ncbi:tail fiber protein [Pseudomonas phage vB_PpuM-NoPa]|uniref:Tail fiber protein n=4 Tax=Tartuvirus TaxID=3424912 RepID=A0AAX4MXJ8_9CAUD
MYALRRSNGDVLYFDAVTNIEEMYTSTVTKHPVATGAFISDHTIRDNKKFTLSAVLSDADFNLDRPQIGQNSEAKIEETGDYVLDPETGYYERRSVNRSQKKQYQNNTPTNTTVKIEQTVTNTWQNYLPETVSQFTKSTIPTVTVEPQSKVKTALAVRDELIAMWEQKEPFVLLEYENNIVSRYWPSVVFTRLSFAQDAETGLGLFPQMSIEQVTYTDVENVPIQIRKINNKGRKSGTVTTSETKAGDDAANEPTQKSKQSALSRAVGNAASNSNNQSQGN